MPAEVHLLGIRHHGPGCARAVVEALDALAPTLLLVEGPPEADALLARIADPALDPPVALLAHVADAPARAVFYPYAAFSPEWQALRWALSGGEDYELLFTVKNESAVPEEFEGLSLTRIGTILEGNAGRMRIGGEYELLPMGYDHFR